MYNAVQSLLNQNAVIWEPVPAMVNTIKSFELLLAEIETYQQIAQGNKKGITLQKAAQQELVISHTYELLSVLYAMATRTNNPVLESKVNFTESDLLKKRDTQLVSVCLMIAEIGTEYLADLSVYGVTESELIILKEEIKLFADNLPTGRISVSERKAANEKLRDLFVQVDALLKKQLDRLMIRYRKSHPDFYSLYQNTRRIVNYGTRHEKNQEPENIAQGVNN
jgi:hypothetical protein